VFLTPSPFACYASHPIGNNGAVLGILFDRNAPDRTSARAPSAFFNDVESAKIVDTGGRRPVESYWGRSIAFLRDPGGSWKKVLRDPVGDILCYCAHVRGLHLYFSSLSDFLKLEAQPLTVNWNHLALRVVTGNAWAEESALNEIVCIR